MFSHLQLWYLLDLSFVVGDMGHGVSQLPLRWTWVGIIMSSLQVKKVGLKGLRAYVYAASTESAEPGSNPGLLNSLFITYSASCMGALIFLY